MIHADEFYGRCSLCGASSRAVWRSDGSWGPVHHSHCQTLRKIEETYPMPNSAPIPLEAIPGPNGCPAAHLLSSEREAFAAASKESVAALWLLVELGELGLRHSERDGDDDVADIFQRVVDAAQWGLGHKKAVTNPDDLASLSDDASAGKPSAPSSPGKPS